jgi:hypothetical protein
MPHLYSRGAITKNDRPSSPPAGGRHPADTIGTVRVAAVVLSLLSGVTIAVFGLFTAGLACMDVAPSRIAGCGVQTVAPFAIIALVVAAAGIVAAIRRRRLRLVVVVCAPITLFGIAMAASLAGIGR